MRIIHVSDTHSYFPALPDGDIVIHSGDFFPDGRDRILEKKIPYQTNWLRAKAETIKEWVGDRPFLFCQGNHDYIDIQPVLVEYGVRALDLTNRVVKIEGLTLYGFPFVPLYKGNWNNEKTAQEMNDEIRYMLDRIKDSGSSLDILVAHCPPYGVLDFTKHETRIGNSQLTNCLTYSQFDPMPKHLLCGHVHEDTGYAEVFGIKVSQAATKVHMIEYIK